MRCSTPLTLFGLLLLTTLAEARSPNIEHGREIALHGSENGAQACAACHQESGVGDTGGAFPRLTGQIAFYLYKQLRDFAGGARDNQVMAPIAQKLDEAEMEDVAGYYASMSGPFTPPSSSDPRLVQGGGVIAASGIPDRNVPACTNCHGQSGAGMPPSFPYLAGQFAVYTRNQLAAWKDGSRRNDPLNVMRDIAARLGDEDIAALAAYFAEVPPPRR